MKVAIMQPYFFPYLGYFQLIVASDKFILFDDVQYIRHGWINRNRILKPVQDWQYIIVPLQAHNRDSLIKDIKVTEDEEWKLKISRQIEHYKKKAPFYNATKDLLEKCFQETETNIAKLNGIYIKHICDYLNIPFEVLVSSELKFDYSHVTDAGEWALKISEQIGASEYINPLSGKELFDAEKFKKSAIKLRFLKPNDIGYSQRRNGVVEVGLSIIDVMMFNSPEEINLLLKKYSIH